MIKVLVVEDQRIHREYMENLLLHSGRYELLQSVTAADIAVQLLKTMSVDLVLMDIVVNGSLDGIEAAREIKQRRPGIKIIIVTSMLDADYLRRARKAGADSMWYKDAGSSSLAEVINGTLNGKQVFPDETPEVQIGAVSSKELTGTEVKVLRLIVEGYEYEEIGDRLAISLSTVKWHVSNILHKTGYANRTRLAVAVSQKNFIVPKIPDMDM